MVYNRRDFLGSVLAAGVLATAGNAKELLQTSAQKLKGPVKNVLLLLTDDQSAHLECLGTKGISTPATNELATNGVIFNNSFATCASCSPTRSSILTGMYPHSNGHWRNTHSPELLASDEDFSRNSRFAKIEPVGVHEDIPTLVEILKQRGITTCITQKFHLSPAWKYDFDYRLGVSVEEKSNYKVAKKFFSDCGDKPFFMLANIGNTHRPFSPHISKIDAPRVSPDDVELPTNLADTELMRADYAQYLDTVQCADASAGAVIKALKESGQFDNTLIIFTSDQGYCYHRAKATTYDYGIRVPFLVSGPGVVENVTRKELVSHVDIAPTVLDYFGVDIPDNIQGESLKPMLSSTKKVEWRDYVFAEHNAHGPAPIDYYPTRSVCDGRFHFIKNLTPEVKWKGDPKELLGKEGVSQIVGFAGPEDAFQEPFWENRSFRATIEAKEDFPLQYQLLCDAFDRPAEELYDLHKDPDETRNLIDDPDYFKHVNRLRKELRKWMVQTKDPGKALKDVPRRTASDNREITRF